VFRRRLERLGVKQRFGAIGKKGSIALGLVHYAHFRPHQGLGGATPAEIYFGRTPSHVSAIPPPRGRPAEGPIDSPFLVDCLDAEQMLPVLVRKAA
jgi:hypothetical protein